MSDYIVGDVVPFGTVVTNSAGANANAGAMTLSITLDGTAVVGSPFTVTPGNVGEYDKDYTAIAPGLLKGYWQATGANAGAHGQRFNIGSSSDLAFVSLEDMKQFLNIPLAINTNDRELERFILSGCRTVENWCGPVVPRQFTQRITGPARRVKLNKTPVLSIVSAVSITGPAGSIQVVDLDVDEYGRVGYSNGYTSLPWGKYLWTYRAGRTGELNENLIDAVKTIVKERWRSQRGTSGLPRAGGERDNAFIPTGRDPLSPLVAALLDSEMLPVID